MLQSHPTSTSPHLQQATNQQQHRSSNTRGMYGGGNHNGYRGHTSTAPVAPYAFTSTPSLASTNPLGQNPTASQLRSENRAVSAPAAVMGVATASQQRSSVAIDGVNAAPRPDGPSRPLSQVLATSPLDLSLADPRMAAENAAKPSPDRYRRSYRRAETSTAALPSPTTGGSATPSGSGMATVGHLYQHPSQSLSSPALRREYGSPMMSKDDSVLNRQSSDQVKKHRRRSMSGLGNGDIVPQPEPRLAATPPLARSYASVVSTLYNPEKRELRPVNVQPRVPSSHGRNGSDDSVSSRSASRPTSVS